MNAGLLAAEWTKLRSVRSSYLAMIGAVGIAVFGGMFSAAGRGGQWATMTAAQRAEFDPVSLSFDGFAFAQLAFGVLGVLAVSSEYGTGMIRTTFTAAPRRGGVLAAKGLVVGAVSLVLGEGFAFAAFLLAQRMLAPHGLAISMADPGVLRAVTAAGGYLMALALLGLGLGAVVRHTAGAVTLLFGLVFLAPVLAEAVSHDGSPPSAWILWSAANTLVATIPLPAGQPSLGLAGLVCAAYAVVSLGLAALAVTHRDV
jgi:hypothetical protein